MESNMPGWLTLQELRLFRKMELFRGVLIGIRGARVGKRFGVGSRVTVYYPHCLKVGDDVSLGESSYLHCLSSRGVNIGCHTSIDRNLWLHCGGSLEDHDHGFLYIGDHSYIGCNAVLGAGGGIHIGSNVLMGQSINVHSENHIFNDPSRPINDQGVNYQEVIIEDDVWIGSKVTILAGVTIGHGSVIGAGAVVTKTIPPYSIALGVPARIIANRRDDRDENSRLP